MGLWPFIDELQYAKPPRTPQVAVGWSYQRSAHVRSCSASWCRVARTSKTRRVPNQPTPTCLCCPTLRMNCWQSGPPTGRACATLRESTEGPPSCPHDVPRELEAGAREVPTTSTYCPTRCTRMPNQKSSFSSWYKRGQQGALPRLKNLPAPSRIFKTGAQ